MNAFPSMDLRILAPEISVAVALVALLALDLLLGERRRALLRWPALAAVVVTLGIAATSTQGAFPDSAGMFVRDELTWLFETVLLLALGMAILVGAGYLHRFQLERGEYYALLFASTLGAMIMAGSRDLLLLFLGLETLSIPLYILAAFARRSPRSLEAGMKYFLLGAFSSAFFLYGVALIYGATGTMRLDALPGSHGSFLLLAGMGLLTIGLGFKAAAVPFHLWAPDVYEGAPLPVTAFMSVAAKLGAFAGILRVFPLSLDFLALQWIPVLAGIAAATMILGNTVALLQGNFKRLMAYSSIAHAGYALVGVASGTPSGLWSTVFYLLNYLFMTLGAFAVVALLERDGAEADLIEDYAGVGARRPLLGVAMALFMASLAGIPPTGGFMAKLYVFTAAIEGGQVGLAVLGVLTSVVSVYYYMRVAYVVASGEPRPYVQVHSSVPASVAMTLLALGVLLLGILPTPVLSVVQSLITLMQ
ncbi:MAG: NADH-quinone oxidoreductase subunit N [Armatimonadota bacterium]|nr:NADH-quinone oxidoreductase subunit N [Armatimonadota bacterium]MDR5704270.1 NADH-quinone oxidoreductase subunit N [Armatimonadota bacterium]